MPSTGAMGPIEQLLTDDHRRLEALLEQAAAAPPAGEGAASFEGFRAGLLRHIGIEEKILLRQSRAARHGEALPMAAELRVQHGAIASLLVPTPTPAIVAELRALLAEHNLHEEGEAGLYHQCDQLLAPHAAEIVALIHAAPAVPLAAHFDGPGVHRTGCGRAGRFAPRPSLLTGRTTWRAQRGVCADRTVLVGGPSLRRPLGRWRQVAVGNRGVVQQRCEEGPLQPISLSAAARAASVHRSEGGADSPSCSVDAAPVGLWRRRAQGTVSPGGAAASHAVV